MASGVNEPQSDMPELALSDGARNGLRIDAQSGWLSQGPPWQPSCEQDSHSMARCRAQHEYDGDSEPVQGDSPPSYSDDDQDPTPFTAPLGRPLSHQEAAQILEQQFPEVPEEEYGFELPEDA